MQWNTIKNFIISKIYWVLYATLVVVVGIGVWAFLSARNAKTEQVALDALFKVQLEAKEKKLNFAQVKEQLETVAKAHPKTRASFEALLNLGDQAVSAKDFDAAISAYTAASEVKVDDFSHVLALYSLGIAQETKENCDAAVQNFDRGLKVKKAQFMRPELLLAKARCLEQLKRYAEADTIYQEMKTEFPENTYYNGAASLFAADLKLKMSQGHATK